MKTGKILIGFMLAALILLTGCSGDTERGAEDAALYGELKGVWFYPDSAVYDTDGDLTSFTAYQFTDEAVKRHDVTNSRVVSSLLGRYTIKDGKYAFVFNGQKQYALIEIRDVDGKDHLFWDNDTKTMEFVRMTDEEIEEYGIPADMMLDGEAELLGIETAAETKAASETSAASE